MTKKKTKTLVDQIWAKERKYNKPMTRGEVIDTLSCCDMVDGVPVLVLEEFIYEQDGDLLLDKTDLTQVTRRLTRILDNLVDSKDPKKELKRVEEELLKLKKENNNLKAEYKQSETEAAMVIDRLKEQNRMAMAKAREIEQNIHFEAAVTAEVSRLRSESSVVKKCISEFMFKCYLLLTLI